jgi:MATE family multidrug resistance protein
MSLSPGAALPTGRDWHKRVLTLALPVVLANLTQPILGAVDTAVAGHLGSSADLGGVALGGIFFNFVFWGFGFLRMGTTGLVAQAYGAEDRLALRANLARALLLAFVIGVLILSLQAPLIHHVLKLIGGSDAVQRNAQLYCHARIGAAPFALANYVVLGYLLGLQRVRMALLIQVLINVVNVLAVFGYVYGFGWGIAGIGAATATADTVGFFCGAAVLWQLRSRALVPLSWIMLAEPVALRRLVAINRDIFLRTMCLLGAFGWFAHVGAHQSDTILAANALLLNFQTVMAYGLDGFAHAAEALVGAAIGSRDRNAFHLAVRVNLLWAVLGAFGFSLTYWVAGGWIIAQLTDQIEVRAAALAFLPWVAMLPLVSVWGFLLDGIFIGATRTRELMQAMALSLTLFLVACWVLVGPFGNHGLWLALLIFMAVRGLALWPYVPRITAGLRAG